MNAVYCMETQNGRRDPAFSGRRDPAFSALAVNPGGALSGLPHFGGLLEAVLENAVD